MSSLRQIVLFVRRGMLNNAIEFYGASGIGLTPLSVTETTAKLYSSTAVSNETPILIKEIDGNEAFLATGYGPFLNFEVEDFDMKIPTLISMGAQLDGKIEYTPVAKVASLRSPHGHMIGLLEKI